MAMDMVPEKINDGMLAGIYRTFACPTCPRQLQSYFGEKLPCASCYRKPTVKLLLPRHVLEDCGMGAAGAFASQIALVFEWRGTDRYTAHWVPTPCLDPSVNTELTRRLTEAGLGAAFIQPTAKQIGESKNHACAAVLGIVQDAYVKAGRPFLSMPEEHGAIRAAVEVHVAKGGRNVSLDDVLLYSRRELDAQKLGRAKRTTIEKVAPVVENGERPAPDVQRKQVQATLPPNHTVGDVRGQARGVMFEKPGECRLGCACPVHKPAHPEPWRPSVTDEDLLPDAGR